MFDTPKQNVYDSIADFYKENLENNQNFDYFTSHEAIKLSQAISLKRIADSLELITNKMNWKEYD